MLIDSHCHLDFPQFDGDRAEVLGRAYQAGIHGAIIPSVGPENWARVIDTCRQHPRLWFALGFHPCFASSDSVGQLNRLQSLLDANPRNLVAVGECGLDGVASALPMDQQQRLCLEQMALANRFRLPVIFHIRKAHHHLFSLLDREPLKAGGVVHGFSGSLEVAREYLRRGLYLGVGGVITYQRASKTRAAIQGVPLERLLLETDSPDMPPCGYQGLRNEPARCLLVLQELCHLLDLSSVAVVKKLSENHVRLFTRIS
ncbi:TatD family deoxyribonuclease [Ferrimonas sediminicola]|uniref:TatD family deoxyribonuclease n=1 Tax=Ferrimonas sediminicola TaxID=2569538 RepID=A0A4U1BFS7_9GAMM|nr:TatD family hydrolase [Ferrimonas sediminicola]TKB49270.1 TatD family deoxyribonuclease [Ferrimonas sediminicola]